MIGDDRPALPDQITVFRCPGCERTLTGDYVESNRGKLVCETCGTVLHRDYMAGYIHESGAGR